MTDNPSAPNGLLAALLMGEKPWSWNWRYNPNLFNHMHALGVIAANYNALEGEFYRLFFVTSDKMEVGKLVFAKLNNAERIQIARAIAETEPPPFQELFLYFLDCFGTITENRNILMHSQTHDLWPYDLEDTHLTLSKASKIKPDNHGFIRLDVSELRRIADEMHEAASFGFKLFLWRFAIITGGTITWSDGSQLTPSLPEKPAEPRKLVLGPPPILKDSPPQPEASRK